MLSLKNIIPFNFYLADGIIEMSGSSTPRRMDQNSILKAQETRKRLEKCWSEDIDWNLYPESLKKVNST